jgi:hypothetical protein
LLWALGCLLGSSVVPFPLVDCRAWFNDLLQYIDSTRERNTMHALVCCLDVTLSRLFATSPAPGAAADSSSQIGEKQQTIRAILKLLTQVWLSVGCLDPARCIVTIFTGAL